VKKSTSEENGERLEERGIAVFPPTSFSPRKGRGASARVGALLVQKGWSLHKRGWSRVAGDVTQDAAGCSDAGG